MAPTDSTATDEKPPARKRASRSKRPVAARGQGAKLREEIVAAGVGLVEDIDDPWQLSLRAVAREVGVAATSIYLHFDSLDELLIAVKTELWTEFGHQLAAAGKAAGPTPYDRVRAFGRAYIAFAQQRPGAFRTMFLTSWDLTLPDDQQFVGDAQFELVVNAMLEVTDDRDEAYRRSIQMWCGLHGMIVLRTPLSRFPWPDLDDQLDELARRWTTP